MSRKSKLNLIRDDNEAPGTVSSLTADEQARYGNLADIALDRKDEPIIATAGSRAHQEHENLKQELLETLEQLERERNNAA